MCEFEVGFIHDFKIFGTAYTHIARQFTEVGVYFYRLEPNLGLLLSSFSLPSAVIGYLHFVLDDNSILIRIKRQMACSNLL